MRPASSKSRWESWTTGASRRLAALDVVAVEGDVEVAERDLGAAELADQRVQAAAEDGAAGVDADQREPVRVLILLDDLVGDPDQRPAQIVVIEHDLLVAHLLLLPGLSGPG